MTNKRRIFSVGLDVAVESCLRGLLEGHGVFKSLFILMISET